MSHDPKKPDSQPAKTAPTQMSAEFFCIHSYAGESGPPCGWRGTAAETQRDPKTTTRRCPRCDRATLLEIPRTPDEVN
jgi:hypothetical protein